MPFYEYKCKNCNNIKEVFTNTFNKLEPPKFCECGNPKYDIILTTTAFQLKGDGWSKDNYKGK